MCVPGHACVYAGDGWTDEQRMERWVDLMCVCVCVCVCVCARARARPCMHACDPVCEDGMIDASSDG